MLAEREHYERSKQHNYEGFKTPTYTNQLNSPPQIIFKALRYMPGVFESHEMPEIKVVGITEVKDCIGIVGWHPKAMLIHHMNEPYENRLTYALLTLAKKTGQLPQSIVTMVDDLLKQLSSEFEKYNLESLRIALISAKAFKNAQFTLVTQYTRNIEPLLKFFYRFGIEKQQISIDSQ